MGHLSPALPSAIRSQLAPSRQGALLGSANRFFCHHQKQGIAIRAYGSKGYPHRLSQLYDPPSLLYVSSRTDLDAPHVVGIVGTRKPSGYGKEVTKELVRQLKAYQPLVVSGLAYGIDITAHREALVQGLPTVAVMAGGADKVYPSTHAPTLRAMTAAGGGFASTYSLGSEVALHHFPARNKLIAGLCDALIVVEAPSKSGALITAQHANEYNREVFAVPGSIHSPQSQGTHSLIQKHAAQLFTHVDEVARVMKWTQKEGLRSPSKQALPRLSAAEHKAVLFLRNTPQKMAPLPVLQDALQLSLQEMASLALNLEIKGLIHMMADHYVLDKNV